MLHLNQIEIDPIEFLSLIKNDSIIYLNWIPAFDIHQIFLSSDLAFFPGTHSVHWEEAIGLGLPCVFKSWDGIKHLDVGGNCIFLDNISEASIVYILDKVVNNRSFYVQLNEFAKKLGPLNFSYSLIAQKSINI